MISLLRAAVDLPLRYARQRAVIAAHRNAEGRCAECNAVSMGKDGICDDCWVEQHAGP